MRVKHKEKGYLGYSGDFNICSIDEIIVGFDDNPDGTHNGADSCFMTDYYVFLEATQTWKDMPQAFRDKDIITDEYNTYFFEPKTKEDRERGYTL